MTTFDLTGTQQEIELIQEIAQGGGDIELSEPSSLDASKAQNASVTAEDLKSALTFVTVAFQTGTTAIVFLKALREGLKDRGGKVAVSKPATGEKLGRIEGGTADENIEKIVVP